MNRVENSVPDRVDPYSILSDMLPPALFDRIRVYQHDMDSRKPLLLCTAGFSYCGYEETCRNKEHCAFHHTREVFVDSSEYTGYTILIPMYSKETRRLQSGTFSDALLYERLAFEFSRLTVENDWRPLNIIAKSAGAGWVLRLIRVMRVQSYSLQAPDIVGLEIENRPILCGQRCFLGWHVDDKKIPANRKNASGVTNKDLMLNHIEEFSKMKPAYLEYSEKGTDGSNHGFIKKFINRCLVEDVDGVKSNSTGKN